MVIFIPWFLVILLVMILLESLEGALVLLLHHPGLACGICIFFLYCVDDLKFNSNKNHFVNFTRATFVLATHVEGSFSSTSLSGDMKIFFIANIL